MICKSALVTDIFTIGASVWLRFLNHLLLGRCTLFTLALKVLCKFSLLYSGSLLTTKTTMGFSSLWFLNSFPDQILRRKFIGG